MQLLFKIIWMIWSNFRNLQIANRISMQTVKTVLNRKKLNPVSVSPGTTVLQALQIMAEKNIGSVIVMEGTSFKGIITERDYSRKVILKGKSSTDTRVEEIMSTDLPAAKPSDTIDHCMAEMTRLNIRYMPVFENDQLTGIISMSDVVKETILSQKETIHQLQTYISS